MPSLTAERLRKLALDALEEVMAEAEHRPVRRTWATRFALLYLSYEAPKGRAGEPYRDFWRSMTVEDASRRASALKVALRTMYAYADEERDPERVLFFTEQAKSMMGENEPCRTQRCQGVDGAKGRRHPNPHHGMGR